jgi:DNA repair exonuclease SbcCD nuclease subunit
MAHAREDAISTFRFVHAADIHLDSPLKTLALRAPELAELIGNATRRAFVNIIELCLAEQVEALIIAGDLYDGDQTSMKTARFLAEQLGRLHRAGICTFIIRGNHDNLSRITRELTLPDSVKLFSGRAEAHDFGRPRGNRPVFIHGLSFANAHAPESLLAKYKPAVEGAVNIGILHTSLGGAAGHDPYAPCSVQQLQATGFNYWALGHIHQRSQADGPCTVVMPGIPQGRDINEAGPKSVSLVSIGDDLDINVEERLTSIAQFERVSLDVSGIEDWRDLLRAAGKIIERTRQNTRSEHAILRFRLTGTSPLAFRIRRDAELAKAELDNLAAGVGGTWIEKLELACKPGRVQDDSGNPLFELHDLIASEVMPSDAFRAEAANIIEELQAQLPPELRHIFGSDDAALAATIRTVGAEGMEYVISRLHSSIQAEAN